MEDHYGRGPAQQVLPDVRKLQQPWEEVAEFVLPKRQPWYVRLWRHWFPYKVPQMKHYHPTRHHYDDCH